MNQKQINKWMKKILFGVAIFLLPVGGALAGTGIVSAYGIQDVLANFFGFLSGQEGNENLALPDWAETASAKELLGLLDAGYALSGTEETLVKIDNKNFRYLLQKCSDYEDMGKRSRLITIQGLREYQKRVESTSTDQDGNTSVEVSYESAEEHVQKEVAVSNADTEGMLNLDWRLLYMYAMIRSLDRDGGLGSGAIREEPQQKEPPQKEQDVWMITQEDIDTAYQAVSMKYIYDYDIMVDTRAFFTLDACIELPHETDIYGDPDTATGRYTWYCPHSLMGSAVSGYSALGYLVDGSKVVGIKEAYDDARFQALGEAMAPFYTYDFFCLVFSFIPGGNRILERFQTWRQQAMAGNPTIYVGNFTIEVGSYPPREGTMPDGSIQPKGNAGSTCYPVGNHNTIGEAAVALARSRLHWRYSQDGRMENGAWDCSSMVSRVYHELGLNIVPYGTTITLKNYAIQHNQKIDAGALMPGDAVWYEKVSVADGSISRHVMLYSGNGNVIHAKGVKYGTVEEPLVNTGYQGTAGTTIREMFYFRPYHNISSTFKPQAGVGPGLTATELYLKGEGELVGTILSLAVDDAKKSHILPSITAAQFILESNWGKSALAQRSNNCFGMKTMLSENTWPGSAWDAASYVEMASYEEMEDGRMISVVSKFRSYPSIDAAIADHSAYLTGAKVGGKLRYGGIVGTKNFSEALDILVAGGYATDSKYKEKLSKVIAKHQLDRFDDRYTSLGTGTPAPGQHRWGNAQEIYLHEFATDQYAGFSKINSGAATYYQAAGEAKGITVCVNAGHGTAGGESKQTQSHPDGSGKYTGGTNAAGAVMSMAISSGATHLNGTPEASTNLLVALKMKEILLHRGYNVVMLREKADTQLDNIARTVIANQTSDCHVALHFDSTVTDKGCFYMSVANHAAYRGMEPVRSNWQKHERFGAALVGGLAARGLRVFGEGKLESDLTQTSYSTIPSVDIEYGDRKTDYSSAHINLIAAGICDGIDSYYGQ